ncbi:hypothetical protein [Pseudoxanthomonas composti]|uniref:Uncharacterized protein n=1 Tax=Pseudoxanthomonas composti TaxID=2137479 RepID=A0A4Q1JXX1_9GAMM|nr:hypothetical protein [Pseudoxanthomonas composti]RXR07524.1 hypothetical protein EPA99_06360 [Pseudoxanthomonas composti]
MTKLLRLLASNWKSPVRIGNFSDALRDRKPGEGFREFTTPRRHQGGASVQLGARRVRQHPAGGIIPDMGGNIP